MGAKRGSQGLEIAARPGACYVASVASPLLASTLAALSIATNLTPLAPLEGPALIQYALAEGGYAGALEAVDQANIAVNKDPEANIAQLETAIAELLAFGPELADDPKGREALDLSQLNLARALLLAKDKA